MPSENTHKTDKVADKKADVSKGSNAVGHV